MGRQWPLTLDLDTRRSIRRRLEGIFRIVFDEPGLRLTRETTAETVPAWDSLSLIVLVTTIEEEFGVHFQGEDLAALESVGALEDFLARGPAPDGTLRRSPG